MTAFTHYEKAELIADELLAAHARGESVASMARTHDLRREAVAAELSRHGIGNTSATQEEVLKYVREHPGLSIDDLALHLGKSKSSVSRYLRGTDEHALVVSRKTNPIQKFSDAEMAAALKSAFTQLEDRSKGLSRKRYAEIMADRDDVPAAATYIRRYSSWSAACRRAGITASKARRETYTRGWSDQDILDAVAEFMEQGGTAYHPYAVWARENNRPSGPLLVQRYSAWSEVKQIVVRRRAEKAA